MVSDIIWPRPNLNRLDAEKLFQLLMSQDLKPLSTCAVSQCLAHFQSISDFIIKNFIFPNFYCTEILYKSIFQVNYKYEEYSALFNTFVADEVKDGDAFEVTFDRTMRTPPYLIGKLTAVGTNFRKMSNIISSI